MANRWALVVAIEKCLHPELGGLPYAENDAKAWRDALAAAGFETDRVTTLVGPFATLAGVESHLRRLKKAVKRGDELLVFWAGPGHIADDRSYLCCWDTLPGDAAETAVAIKDLVATVEATKAGQLAFFLAAPGLGDDLEPIFQDVAKTVALAACSSGERVLSAPELKHGVWSQLVAEALKGQARKATTNGGSVTAMSLQRFVEDELPRRLRRHFEGHVQQTPLLLGGQNAGHVLVRLPDVPADGPTLDAGRLRRLAFRAEATTRVRDLTNFRKTFTVPDNAGPGNRKFVQRIAADDLKAEIDRVAEECRERFGYKRKDLHAAVGQDGTATLRTPDFEYTLYVDLLVEDPSQLTWRREVGQFKDAEFIREPAFQAGFGAAFDQLVFEFAKPLDVPAFIDRVEDSSPEGLKLKIGADGKACEITLAGFAGTVSVRRHALTVRGRSGAATGLLDLLLQFLGRVGPLGESLALPPAR